MAAFTTFALLGLGLHAFSAVRQVKAGRAEARAYEVAGAAQRASAESAAQLAGFNAAVADLQAGDALARGEQEEQRFRMGIRGMIGTQRATIAANNIDVGFGTSLDVQADTAYLGELDALTLRTNAAREAWGYKVEAQDYRARAEISRREGVYLERTAREQAKQARSAGNWGAAQTIVGGGMSFMQTRYGFGGSKRG